jgi:hypothetical protein
MIIFSGFGWIVFVVIFGSLVVMQLVTDSIYDDENFYTDHGWPKLLAFCLAGLLLRPMVGWRKRAATSIDAETGEEVVAPQHDSFIFLPLRFWPAACILLGVGLSFVAPPGPSLATIDRDNHQLDDGEVLHRADPEAFALPSLAERENLQTGQFVTLSFRIYTVDENSAPNIEVELLPVRVENRRDGFYRGTLTSQPRCTEDMHPGMDVIFEPRHVIEILE